jgi:hypothetical protein
VRGGRLGGRRASAASAPATRPRQVMK